MQIGRHVAAISDRRTRLRRSLSVVASAVGDRRYRIHHL